MWIQVPSSAPNQYNPNQIFQIGNGFGFFVVLRYNFFLNGKGRQTDRENRQPRNRQRSKVSALCEYLNKQKTVGNPAAFALVLGLEGHDGKRLAQRRQHLQDRIKLRVGVSALHSGDEHAGRGAAGAASPLFSWVMVNRALRCARTQRSFLLMEKQSSVVDASLSMRPAS